MLRVYVAGAYSADNAMDVFANMRRGMQLAAEVADQGLYPFIPWQDVMLHMHAELNLDFCYDYSMSFLETCQAVLVAEGWEDSKGTKAEIARAGELKIPVFYELDELIEWCDEKVRAGVEDHICESHTTPTKPKTPFSAPSFPPSSSLEEFKKFSKELAKDFNEAISPEQTLEELHVELCNTAREIMVRKNNDYTGGGEDRFANFRMSEHLGVHPAVALLVRCMDKFQRIRTFVQNGELQVKGEPVRDAILDTINYMVLLAGLIQDETKPRTGWSKATKLT